MRKVFFLLRPALAAFLLNLPGATALLLAATPEVLIRGVPHILQKPDFCGEACAAMYLRKLGHDISQDDIVNESGLDPSLGRGCWTRELVVGLRNIGFRTGRVWYRVAASRAGAELEARWRELQKDLRNGTPSIVCMRYDEAAKTTEHFRLILGYDDRTGEVIYHEPAVANGAYLRMKKSLFLKLWPLKYQPRTWTVIRLRLEPGKIKKTGKQKTPAPAEFVQHVMKLKPKIPPGFTLLVQSPFVVIGDEAPAKVKRRSRRTVKWAVDHLRKLYFSKNPQRILDIWLFKNKASYRKHTRAIFKEEPGTPFGYYSPAHGALIMNIGTGGGTLVHEIVHPFMAANFPRCPAWFNEGMGSLYEQSGERNGHLVGFTNWRLAGLQKLIKAGRLPSFEKLTHTSEREFYREDPGSNYAQARYLCYYLQEKGLLTKYYHAFAAKGAKDPSGYETLKKILGTTDMAAFQKKWEAWVTRLTFP